MVAPVRWVKVVETLARMRVEEWIELGGGGVLTRMLEDFEIPSLKGITFDDLRTRLYGQAQNFLPHQNGVVSLQVSGGFRFLSVYRAGAALAARRSADLANKKAGAQSPGPTSEAYLVASASASSMASS